MPPSHRTICARPHWRRPLGRLKLFYYLTRTDSTTDMPVKDKAAMVAWLRQRFTEFGEPSKFTDMLATGPTPSEVALNWGKLGLCNLMPLIPDKLTSEAQIAQHTSTPSSALTIWLLTCLRSSTDGEGEHLQGDVPTTSSTSTSVG